MIDAREFDRLLFPWIDGELPPDRAAEMAKWCDAHADARSRADAERAFEGRVRTALLSDASGAGLVADAIRRARAAPARGRVVRFPRWIAAAAASVVVAISGMWWFCIPPFECAFLQAVEAAAEDPGLGEETVEGLLRERVAMVCDEGGCAWRTIVEIDGGRAAILLAASEHEPSVRRRREIDGRIWWVGEEHGRHVVVFPDPAQRGLWSFVGTQDEATLLSAAVRFRDERERVAVK